MQLAKEWDSNLPSISYGSLQQSFKKKVKPDYFKKKRELDSIKIYDEETNAATYDNNKRRWSIL